jgi:hypothetical protein
MNSSSCACHACGSKTPGSVFLGEEKIDQVPRTLASDMHRLDARHAVDDYVLTGHGIRSFGHQGLHAVIRKLAEEAVATTHGVRARRIRLDHRDVHPIE